jgi:AraC family transcriptional activator of mtrCDE
MDNDVFSELALLLRVQPELQQICLFGAQWSSPHEPEREGWAPFHIVTQGACLIDVGDQVGLRLEEGDVAVLPHGGRHTTRALSGAMGTSSGLRVQTRANDHLVVKSNVDGEPDTKLICGRLIFEHAKHNLVLAALPSVVIMKTGADRDAMLMREIVEAIRFELESDRLAAAAVACSLANTLMMIVLRSHFEREHEAKGVLGLLQGRQTARAVTAMIENLAHAWTLDELADISNSSRATLVRLFNKTAGSAPLAFLCELRLNVARHRLLATHEPIGAIADDIGYQSEAAFSRAYHRWFGVAPGADRRAAASPIDRKF